MGVQNSVPKKNVSVRLLPEIRSWIQHYSENNGIPQIRIVLNALQEYFHESDIDRLSHGFIPRSKRVERKMYSIRMPKAAFEKLDKFCSRTGKTVSYVIENALYGYMKVHTPEECEGIDKYIIPMLTQSNADYQREKRLRKQFGFPSSRMAPIDIALKEQKEDKK